MRVPDSVAGAYDEALATAEEVRRFAETKLRILCKQRGWLFDDRLKSAESCLSKLETGRGPISQLRDLYATTVVVPTENELEAAVSAISDIFEIQRDMAKTIDVRSFAYDDIHLAASLGKHVPPAAASEPVRAREFEIQVRTGLQYAWWRATHDQTFKSESPDVASAWAIQRVASQARASLELLDAVLADLASAGRLQSRQTGRGDIDPELVQPAAWLQLWRPSDHPSDLVRFCQTSLRLCRACSTSPEAALTEMESEGMRSVVSSGSITPLQALVIALERLKHPRFEVALTEAGLRVLVTREMIEQHAPLEALTSAVVVSP